MMHGFFGDALADLQRGSEGADAALKPKLLNASKWVEAQAEEQKRNLAAGKTKDGRERKADAAAAPADVWLGSGGTSGGNPAYAAGAGADRVTM